MGPTGPKAAEGGPEQSVVGGEARSRSLAFEHGHLLAESEDFQRRIGSRPDRGSECHEDGEEELEHELTVFNMTLNAGSVSAEDACATD
ncbi:MAG TPA: hypothetical protein VIY49_36135 [Bryobacteraceae bacterium]